MTDSEKLDAIVLMTLDLYADARTKVTDHGRDFTPAYTILNVEGWGYDLTYIALKIMPIPKLITYCEENERNLDISAYRIPLKYKVSRILKVGSKQKLLEHIQTPEFHQHILDILPQLADSLNDL